MMARYCSLIVSCSCLFREGCDMAKVANILYKGAMRLVIVIVTKVRLLAH